MNKKIIAAVMLIALIVTQLFVPSVFADRDDLAEVVKELDNMHEDSKGILLSRLWDIIEKNIGQDIFVEDAYDLLIGSLDDLKDKEGNIIYPEDLISDDAQPGKISKSSVELLLQKMLDHRYKAIIEEIYAEYEPIIKKSIVKDVLNLDQDATSGAVFVALTDLSVPVLALDGDECFVINADVAAGIARKLGQKLSALDADKLDKIIGSVAADDNSDAVKVIIDLLTEMRDIMSKDDLAELLARLIYPVLVANDKTTDIDMNGRIEKIANKINERIPYQGITSNDVISVLELYDLYEEDPTAPAFSSSNPASGATGVSTSIVIKVTYNKDIYEGSTFGNITLKAGSTAVPVANTVSGKVLTITPSSSLANSTAYTLTIPEGAVASEVMRSAAATTITFTTAGSGGSVTPPPSGDDGNGTTPTQPEEPKADEEQEKAVSEVEKIVEGIKEEDIVAATEDKLADIAQDVSKKLTEATQLITAIKDPEAATNLAKDLIQKSGALATKLAVTNNTASYDSIVKDVKQLASAVMSNAGALTVASENITSADGKVTAQVKLGEAEKGKLIDKATEDKLDLIVNTAQQLNQAAIEAGIDEAIAAPVLYLDATTDTDSVSASAEIPSNLILALQEKGIDSMMVATDVATFKVPSSAISVEADAVIKLNSEKVDTSALSAEAREVVGNAPVFDLYITVNDERVSNFNSLIGVSVPYTLSEGENPEKVTVFYINEEGQLENVIGVYDEETKTVYFETEHFSEYVVKVNNVTFEDVDSKFWASNYIEVMASKGVIKGIGDGSKFAPSNNVTRAEFVAMVVREFKLFDDNASNNFKDISEKDWFYPEVTAAAKLGIIQGRPGGVFAPNDKITREEMAKILSNVLTLQLGKKAPANAGTLLESFTDSNLIADYAKDAVAIGVRYGMFSGRPDGSFAPKDNANRAEASKLIYMLFYMK